MAPTLEQTNALNQVISQLEVYRGEKIAVHQEHPLRLAVIELEKLCFDRGENVGHRGVQRYALFPPARNYWFNLLRSSRGVSLISDELRLTAIGYRDALQKELQHWLIDFSENTT